MIIKVFAKNDKNKIEFTEEELNTLLNEIYNKGYAEGSAKLFTWSSTTTPYTITNARSNIDITTLPDRAIDDITY